MSDIKYPDVKCRLTGTDGNAFAIIGAVAHALKRAGLKEEAKAWQTEALRSPSYDALLQSAMRTVDVS